jgi:hypothetical protein
MSDDAHWLDRLAVRLTRRQALKAAAAGAALSSFPLVRTGIARADDPHACQQGCLWTSHQTAESGFNHCSFGGTLAGLLIYGYGVPLGFGIFGPLTQGSYATWRLSTGCSDTVLANAKADNASCLQPNCPNFNPKSANGPCEGTHDYCCPCASVIQGYQPCVYPCDDPSHSCC